MYVFSNFKDNQDTEDLHVQDIEMNNHFICSDDEEIENKMLYIPM